MKGNTAEEDSSDVAGGSQQLSPRFGSQISEKHNTVGMHGQSQHEFIKQSENIPSHQQVWITKQQLSEHTSQDDAWLSLDGVVYDVTTYLKHHPGGKPKLLQGCGIECRHLFDEIHPWVSAKYLLKHVKIGYLSADRLI